MTYSRNRLSSKKPSPHMTNSTRKPETPDSENSGGSRSGDRYSSQCFRKGRTQVWAAGRCLNSLSVRVLCCRERVRAYGKNASSIPRPAPPGRNVKATSLTAWEQAGRRQQGCSKEVRGPGSVFSRLRWDHVVLHDMWPHYTSAFKSKKCVLRQNYAQYIFCIRA